MDEYIFRVGAIPVAETIQEFREISSKFKIFMSFEAIRTFQYCHV